MKNEDPQYFWVFQIIFPLFCPINFCLFHEQQASKRVHANKQTQQLQEERRAGTFFMRNVHIIKSKIVRLFLREGERTLSDEKNVFKSKMCGEF